MSIVGSSKLDEDFKSGKKNRSFVDRKMRNLKSMQIMIDFVQSQLVSNLCK